MAEKAKEPLVMNDGPFLQLGLSAGSSPEPFPWAAGHPLKNAQVAKLSAKALMNGSNYIQVAEPTAILIKSGPGKLFGSNTRESLRKILPKH